jgi:hypothetical protein
MVTAGQPIVEHDADRARHGRLGWLADLGVVQSAELRGPEPDSTPAAAAAHQDARWWRGEVACLRLALDPGLVASTLYAALQAVPGQLPFLLTRATASRAHALVVGAVRLLPADISGLARLWARQSPGKGAGRLTEPPLDTSLNSETGEADGIEGGPFQTGIPTVRGCWDG